MGIANFVVAFLALVAAVVAAWFAYRAVAVATRRPDVTIGLADIGGKGVLGEPVSINQKQLVGTAVSAHGLRVLVQNHGSVGTANYRVTLYLPKGHDPLPELYTGMPLSLRPGQQTTINGNLYAEAYFEGTFLPKTASHPIELVRFFMVAKPFDGVIPWRFSSMDGYEVTGEQRVTLL